MEIPDEFQEIGFFLADNRFVAILKEMSSAMVPTIKRPRIPGEQ